MIIQEIFIFNDIDVDEFIEKENINSKRKNGFKQLALVSSFIFKENYDENYGL